MTLRSEIREALLAGPKNAVQIYEACDGIADEKKAAQNLSALKAEGKIKAIGTIDGRISYGIAAWPEAGEGAKPRRTKAAPPPKRAYKKRKASRARAAEVSASTPVLPNGAASFAIT